MELPTIRANVPVMTAVITDRKDNLQAISPYPCAGINVKFIVAAFVDNQNLGEVNF